MAIQQNTLKAPPLQELCSFIEYKDRQFNCWNPAHSGDITRDTQIGMLYALQYINLTHKHPAEAYTLLSDIVRDMNKEEFNTLEMSFFETLSDTLISLLQSGEGLRKAQDAWQDNMFWQLRSVEEDARMNGGAA